MIREESSGQCLRFMGGAGTSGSGTEGVKLENCDPDNDRFFWHLGNRDRKTKKCCGGIRAWNTDQCFQGGQGGGRGVTGICELSGAHTGQGWSLKPDGQLARGSTCVGPADNGKGIQEAPCMSFRSKGGARFSKQHTREPIERTLYVKAQREHPEVFATLNKQLKLDDATLGVPKACLKPGAECFTLTYGAEAGGNRCLTSDGSLSTSKDECSLFVHSAEAFQLAESGDCLDTWSDMDPETWGFYGCHGGTVQKFKNTEGSIYCTLVEIDQPQCFELKHWSPSSAAA